jgi:tRNA pseudouridine13 synthase
MSFSFDFSFAHGGPISSSSLRIFPEDFVVDEVLPFAPSGEGEHVYIHVRKRNTNTEWLARQIARFAGVTLKEIGYAGLKDRNAVTTQWFSVHLPGKKDLSWKDFQLDDVEVLEAARHNRKLKTGSLKENHFRIILRDFISQKGQLGERLEAIRNSGVPNYFGEQRFGHEGENLDKALALFQTKFREKNRHRRGLYLSAARSWIFNQVLSERVSLNTWNQAVTGDCMMLDGSRSFFCIDQADDEIRERLQRQDIHPSGPLWGKGELPSTGECRELEKSISDAIGTTWTTGLEKAGLKQERRALRMKVANLQWDYQDKLLEVGFTLRPGCYATSVLREIACW